VHAQLPLLHLVFAGCVQATPQVPQFSGSIARFAQAACASQVVGCAGSKQPHAPPLHASFASAVQALPHVLQFRGSTERSRHQGHGSPAQWVPDVQGSHVPPLHAPTPQSCPHRPQFAPSVMKSEQAPPQQLRPAPQATPHPPQFAGSEPPSTHFPPHSIVGSRHSSGLARHPTAERETSRATRAGAGVFTERIIERRHAARGAACRRPPPAGPPAAERRAGPC